MSTRQISTLTLEYGSPEFQEVSMVDPAALTPDGDQPKKMTIIAWSGDLDKAWPTLILATTEIYTSLFVGSVRCV